MSKHSEVEAALASLVAACWAFRAEMAEMCDEWQGDDAWHEVDWLPLKEAVEQAEATLRSVQPS